jgi:hypothetical protein
MSYDTSFKKQKAVDADNESLSVIYIKLIGCMLMTTIIGSTTLN